MQTLHIKKGDAFVPLFDIPSFKNKPSTIIVEDTPMGTVTAQVKYIHNRIISIDFTSDVEPAPKMLENHTGRFIYGLQRYIALCDEIPYVELKNFADKIVQQEKDHALKTQVEAYNAMLIAFDEAKQSLLAFAEKVGEGQFNKDGEPSKKYRDQVNNHFAKLEEKYDGPHLQVHTSFPKYITQTDPLGVHVNVSSRWAAWNGKRGEYKMSYRIGQNPYNREPVSFEQVSKGEAKVEELEIKILSLKSEIEKTRLPYAALLS